MRSHQLAILILMSDGALGLYFMAAPIPKIAIIAVSGSLTRATFPTLTLVVDKADQLRGVYLSAVADSMGLMALISLGLASLALLMTVVPFRDS
ncbi:hypothetical protein C1J03_15440 [Sulfitobacter sp. SK012]|uniref:oligosaccharide flippase family protein n=1 Tax=Sulfitobacter sp. SK012 TaxID=1389005 RepID=UPI000E10AED8|nr:oligosaccharide flippase family protein [Sulfitobacter sp. SK012]AXI47280.1 hypothetical protein C1J03_15440 [Sulfitobacter sp. SK012]